MIMDGAEYIFIFRYDKFRGAAGSHFVVKVTKVRTMSVRIRFFREYTSWLPYEKIPEICLWNIKMTSSMSALSIHLHVYIYFAFENAIVSYFSVGMNARIYTYEINKIYIGPFDL